MWRFHNLFLLTANNSKETSLNQIPDTAFSLSAMTVDSQERRQKLLRGNRGRRNRFEQIGYETNNRRHQHHIVRDVHLSIEDVQLPVTEQNLKPATFNNSTLKLALPSGLLSSSLLHNNLNDPTNSVSDRQLQEIIYEIEHFQSKKDVIIAGILIALTVMLMVIFLFLIYEPIVSFFRQKFGRFAKENKTLVERRYKTIDKWLIQKVSILSMPFDWRLAPRQSHSQPLLHSFRPRPSKRTMTLVRIFNITIDWGLGRARSENIQIVWGFQAWRCPWPSTKQQKIAPHHFVWRRVSTQQKPMIWVAAVVPAVTVMEMKLTIQCKTTDSNLKMVIQ